MQKINLSTFSRQKFQKLFGDVFEHSPQFAMAVFALHPEGEFSQGTLHQAFCQSFDSATEKEKLKVLLAHPSLAGKLAKAKKLTVNSTSEQKNAGLENLTPEMQSQFSMLNNEYEKKFAFPFIICVANLTPENILQAFKNRIKNNRQQEFATACAEVKKIAAVRTEKIFKELAA